MSSRIEDRAEALLASAEGLMEELILAGTLLRALAKEFAVHDSRLVRVEGQIETIFRLGNSEHPPEPTRRAATNDVK